MHVLVDSGARLGDAAAPHWYRTGLGVQHVLGSERVSARYTSCQVHVMLLPGASSSVSPRVLMSAPQGTHQSGVSVPVDGRRCA